MKIVYFGSGEFGLPTLKRLSQMHEVLAVVTQPDRPAGRSRAMTPTPIGAWAAEHRRGTLLLKPEKVNEPRVVEEIRALDADAFVVIAFGQKMGTALLADRFAVNLHASLLPRWRGAAPINHAILAGDTETGNSVITLAEKMDAGLVLGQSKREIERLVTAGELHDQLSQDGPSLVEAVLKSHAAGTLKGIAQDESLVTLAPKFSKGDGWIDFTKSAEVARRRVHGLTPWPGVTVQLRDEPLKILRVQTRKDVEAAGKDGEVIDAARGLISCGGNSVLELLEVQPAGGKAMSWGDLARGRRISSGEILIGGAA